MKNKSGFTLLEIVIVITLVAFMVGIGYSRLGSKKAQIQATVRKIAVVAKDLKYKSKLKNATYRLVLQVAPREEDRVSEDAPTENKYWVEKAPGSVISSSGLEEEGDEDEEDENAPPDPNGFILDQQVLKQPETLPPGMIFERIELANQEDPIREGVAYIYFLPEGYINESAIHLQYDEKLHWTIAIHPLTGRADIFDEDVSLDTLRQ